MLSIIITAYKEPATITRAIRALRKQNIPEKFELLVVCPDKETAAAASKFARVKQLTDKGIGKPAAMNLALKRAKGDVLLFTDGDVFVGKGAIAALLRALQKKGYGAVCGRPIPLNNKNGLFGYWAHLLTDAADTVRRKRTVQGKYIDCTGYLYAIKAGIVQAIPQDALSDDAVISSKVWQAGLKIAYAPKAKVFVKYPDNWSDWIKQKRRSTGGYIQSQYLHKKQRMRSFSREALGGWFALSYAKNAKELWWTLLLVLARLWLWINILFTIKLQKQPFQHIWTRVESTKKL